MNTMIQSPQFLPNNRFPFTIHHPNLHLTQPRFHKPTTITSARTTNKGFFRSKRSTKTLIQLAHFTASHFPHLFPEPLNSVIREFSGGGSSGSGGGGYGGFWKGFGWGGFDGGGRRRRVNKKSKLWLLGFVVVCWLGFWWLSLNGRVEVKNDVVLGAMCLSVFLVLVKNGGVGEWVLGFLSGGAVVGLLVGKNDEVKKFVRGFEMMPVLRRQRQRRRRGV